jgi:alginate O-acetyltransferase complex protein AlgJ
MRLNAHEERSQQELAETQVSPRVARVMSLAFVALLLVVPLSQTAIELRAQGWIQALDVFTQRPTRETLHAYERALESQSAIKRAVQPRLQEAITAAVRVGNDRAVLGDGGWLFYQPGIDYVTGPAFLDAGLLRVRGTRMIDRDRVAAAQPDPRPALRALHEDLARAGIRLLLVPVLDKAAVEADRLAATAGDVLANPDWTRFAADMRAAGVDVFDVPLPAGSEPAYLAQDTHWTPRYMEQVAGALARDVGRGEPSASAEASADKSGSHAPMALHAETATVTRVGDLVDMLRLSPGQQLFAPQRVEIRRVVTEDGSRWAPQPSADLLLVGDSFTNIYSDPAMGWGDSAGFAEHLSLALGRPLDVLAENGGAAAAVRLSLARAENRPRLIGKRLVIYQFAMRDLVGQHWPVVRLPLAATGVSAKPDVARPDEGRGFSPAEIEIEGTIVQTSQVPDPQSAPYASCVGMVRVKIDRVVQGQFAGRELVAGLLVMRNRALLPPARYAAGDRLRLRLIPFSRAGREIRGLQRSDDIEGFDLPLFWTLEESRQ